MATDYHAIDDATPRRRWLRLLLLLVLAFAAGAATMGYVLTHWPLAARTIVGGTSATTPSTPRTAAVRPVAVLPVIPPPSDPGREAAVERRVSGLEGRIGLIGARASAAAGNADRAEGLLVAFAARRAVDRGVALGYIEALLRDRFGTSQPRAVATIISAARQPVTLDDLRAGLAAVAPALAGGDLDESWLDGIRRELAGLVVVRRANVPSPDPADRLARATRALDGGRVAAALAEVARMPGRDAAARWIASARRYAAVHDALDVIETAALLEPRGVQPPPETIPAAPPADGATPGNEGEP